MPGGPKFEPTFEGNCEALRCANPVSMARYGRTFPSWFVKPTRSTSPTRRGLTYRVHSVASHRNDLADVNWGTPGHAW